MAGKKFKGQGAIGKAMDAVIAQTMIRDQAVVRKLARMFAEEAAKLIYQRTKAGKGVDVYGGAEKAFRALSPAYVARRSLFGGLHPTTSPGKSNLTYTGQMLESLRVEERAGKFFVVVGGARRDGKTNAQVAAYAEQGGRRFLQLSRAQLDKLNRSYRRNFAALVKSGKAR